MNLAVPAPRVAKNGEVCGELATGRSPTVTCDKGLACLKKSGTKLLCDVPPAPPSWLQGVFTDGELTVTPSTQQSAASVLATLAMKVNPNELGLPVGPADITVFG